MVYGAKSPHQYNQLTLGQHQLNQSAASVRFEPSELPPSEALPSEALPSELLALLSAASSEPAFLSFFLAPVPPWFSASTAFFRTDRTDGNCADASFFEDPD